MNSCPSFSCKNWREFQPVNFKNLSSGCATLNKRSLKNKTRRWLYSRMMNRSRFSKVSRVKALDATLSLKNQRRSRELRKKRRKTRKMMKKSKEKDRTSLKQSLSASWKRERLRIMLTWSTSVCVRSTSSRLNLQWSEIEFLLSWRESTSREMKPIVLSTSTCHDCDEIYHAIENLSCLKLYS